MATLLRFWHDDRLLLLRSDMALPAVRPRATLFRWVSARDDRFRCGQEAFLFFGYRYEGTPDFAFIFNSPYSQAPI